MHKYFYKFLIITLIIFLGRNIARLENTQAIGILGETMVERQAKLVAENELNIN